MDILLNPSHPDHVGTTMAILDQDADGVIEDSEMDGSVWS